MLGGFQIFLSPIEMNTTNQQQIVLFSEPRTKSKLLVALKWTTAQHSVLLSRSSTDLLWFVYSLVCHPQVHGHFLILFASFYTLISSEELVSQFGPSCMPSTKWNSTWHVGPKYGDNIAEHVRPFFIEVPWSTINVQLSNWKKRLFLSKAWHRWPWTRQRRRVYGLFFAMKVGIHPGWEAGGSPGWTLPGGSKNQWIFWMEHKTEVYLE